MTPAWFDVFNVAFVLFVVLIVIAGAIAWVVDAIRHHRARCNRILSPRTQVFMRDFRN